MQEEAPAHSWFGPTLLDTSHDASEDPHELARLWRGFMTARLTLGLVLVALQVALYITGASHSHWLIAISAVYFAGTVASRLLTTPQPLGNAFNRNWLLLVGLDVLTFASLQWMQGNNLNYTPLFALPILLASVLGSLRMALGTAAGVTMLLLGGTLWTYLGSQTDATPYFVQAALSGVGYFAIALLANQLSTRLADERLRARRSQVAARIQRQVNELVIESLPDGVLIVDGSGAVRAANPLHGSCWVLGGHSTPRYLTCAMSRDGFRCRTSHACAWAQGATRRPTSPYGTKATARAACAPARGLPPPREAKEKASACCFCRICANWKHVCAPTN